jgi:alcohol dehydrogenase class IV
MRFEFATAGRVLFGAGTLCEFMPSQFGRNAFVVGGRNAARLEPLLRILKEDGVAFTAFPIHGEPTIEIVSNAVRAARESGCDFVIGFGGGSAIDTAKAVAALLTNSGDIFEYLEVIGHSSPLKNPPLPFVAIPTTAGAGAEVTRNAVIASPQHRVKASLRSPLLLPRLAIVDPELTLNLPRPLTASTGMDALTQLIEPYVSIRANPMADSLCQEGIPRAARFLKRACEQPEDLQARTAMSLASLFGGMALGNAGLGAVHGFAAPIGGMFSAPHGAICATLLPHVMEMNLRALEERRPESPARPRYKEIARWLTGRDEVEARDGVEWVRQLCADLDIRPLRSYGLTAKDVSAVCEKAAAASSMKANPLPLTQSELQEILFAAL